MRVAIGGLNQESNAFTTTHSTRADFVEIPPEKIVRAFAGTSNEIAAFLQTSTDHGADPVPVGFAFAETGGLADAATAEALVDELVERAVDAEPEVVLLALHGSMAAVGIDDVEGLLLEHLRAALGRQVVIGATLDWHCTITPAMVTHADLLVGYRTYPHIDQFGRAARLAELAFAARAGHIRPTGAGAHPPLIVAGPKTSHENEPMRGLLARIEALMGGEPSVLDWSLCPGYARSDVPQAGVHTHVITDDDADLARRLAVRVADLVWEQRHAFLPDLTSIDDAMRIIRAEPGRVVLSDQGDNPGGGAGADSTVLLEALLAEVVAHADAYTDGRSLVVCGVCDPAAVDAAHAAGVGGRFAAPVGAIRLDAVVEHLADGDYVMRSPTHDGVRRRVGPTALLAAGPIRVVVTSQRVQNEDLELLTMAGVDIGAARALIVKSNAHFRAAFGPLADRVVDVDTPGLSTPRLERLPYERIDRPVFPLDPEAAWP